MSKTRMGKRVASLLLSLVMMLSLLPTTVYATGGTGETNGANVEATNTFDEGGTTSDPEATSEDEGGGANVSEGETATVATIGSATYETLDAAIAAVADGETIVVNAGEYKLNGSLSYAGKAFTIEAAEGAKVSFDMSAAVALHGAKITFNNVTFDYKTNGNYIGLQHADTLVYNDCTINGMVFLYAVNETFNSCTFEQTSAGAYNVWTYGAQNVAFNGCTFNCVGRCVLVYNEGAIDKTDLTVENTKFNASAPAEGKAAIEIDTSLMEGGATITVDNTTATGFANGSNSGNALWNDKKQTADTNKNTTVTVAGETVFAPKATVVKPVSVNGTSYETLEDAIDAATPDANGVITYEISGKVDVTATGWVQVAKAGLTGLTAVKFVGTTDDAAIYVTKEDAVLADQVYGNVDVSFSGLTLVKENPTYLNDYAEFTQYFAMEIRATVKTGVVTYTDCKFPEGVINNTYGKTVFTGCEFSNDDSRYNLWVKEGEVELNNGAFTGTRGVKLYNTGNAKATITIKDTTFDGLTGKAAIVVSQPAPADVTLKNVTARNCTVGLIQKDTATDATIIKANGESISGTFNITNAGNAKNEFNISAGTFTSEVSNDYCADGFEVKANADGTYGVVEAATAVAKIGDASYETLQAAIDAAAAGETVTLLADITLEGQQLVIGAGKSFTLDLNGKTLKVSKYTAKAAQVDVLGDLTLTDSSENKTGIICSDYTGTAGLVVCVESGGKLTMNGGTITTDGMANAGNALKIASGATVTMNGGTIKCDAKRGNRAVNITGSKSAGASFIMNGGNVVADGGDGTETAIYAIMGAYYSTLVISGSSRVSGPDAVNAANSATTISGGTFTGNIRVKAGSISGGTYDKAIDAKYCKDGFILTANADGTYGVKAGAYVAQIGTAKYTTLAAAIAAANNGETVTLLKDVTENVEIAKEKNLTLDLNGKTLSGGTGTAKAALYNLGTITMRDTSEAKTGTIKRDDNGTVGETSYYVIRNWGTMTIESGNVINNSGYRKVNSTGSMVGSSLICNGDCDEGGTLTIKGGTFTQNNFIAIKNGVLGVLKVTGGTITSNHSAIQNWFEADITGGKITGQLWTDAWEEGKSVGKTTIGGDATFAGEIVMDITGSVAPTLAINGGNLNVTRWRITNDAANAGAKPAVSGGTFSSAVPAKYCAEGFIPTANADGSYGVKAGAYVAQIGDVKYETLQEAIDAVKANETIYVLGNIDLGTDELSTYDVKTTVKNVTIDLGGYTVTSAGKYTVYLKVNGWTIQNGTIQNTNASTTYGTLYVGGSSNSTTLKNLTVESKTNGVQFAIASSKNGIKASITVEDGTKISGNYGVYMKGQPKPWRDTRDGQEILNVNGGEITGTTAAIAVFGAGKGNTKAGVIVNINGGKVYSDSYAIAGNGSSVLENTTINISGGKVFSNKDTAIYHPQAGTVTISGGEVYGVTGGVQMCAGTLNVTGGTISATGNGDVSGKTGDGSIPDGAAVSIVNRAYPAGAPTMTISGGTFTSAAGVGAVQAYGWKNNSQQTWDKPNASVSGGTFSSAVPAEYCAGGFIPTDNGDGTYGVKAGAYVAQIGETTYETLAEAFAVAKDGDTITLLTDCSGNGIVVKAGTFTDKGLIVDFAGYSYTVGGVLVGSSGTKSNGFQLNKNNKITFQNGAIYGDASVAGDDMTNWTGAPAILIQNYCDLTLSGMKVSGGSNTVYTLSNNCGDVVIENTTINAGGGGSGYAPFALDACGYTGYTGVSVTVKGTSAINGDIEVSRSASNENAVTLTLASGTVTGALKIDSSIKSGDATTVTKSSKVTLAAPDGYMWNAEGKLVEAVAQIGDVKYESLQAAFDAAKTGDTVTLLRDITLTEQVNITKALNGLTLDGNNKTITCATTTDPSQSGGSALYFGDPNKSLWCTGIKIKDLTMTGTARFAIFLSGGTTTEFTNVNISGNYYIAVNLYGTHGATMTNCNISNSSAAWDKYGSAIWSNVASQNPLKLVNSKVGVIAINTYTTANTLAPKIFIDKDSSAEIHTFDDGSVSGNKKLCVSTESEGTYTIKEYVDNEWVDLRVAEVLNTKGESQGTYDSLQAAIDAAKRNATVKMLADTRENVTIDKALTLDLNGFTLNGGTEKGKPALTITARTVTIKDSSEAQTGTIMREDTAENSGVSSHYVIDIQGNAWVMFESGNVKNGSGAGGTKGASLVRVGNDSVATYPGLNIKGGTFTQDNFIVIKVDRGDLFLNGGTLNSANTYAVENWFRATIKGGTVNGAVSSWTYSSGSNSTLEISGGTVNGAVTSVNYGDADKVAKVEITGGTVNGELDTRSYDPKTGELTSIDDAAKATIKVTGGTFKENPTKYVVEGSTVKTNTDGTFGVEKAYLARIGETSYYTMDEAFKAQTTSGEPIVMLRDYTTGGTFNSGSIDRTVDLNGHTWTYTGTDTNDAAFEINHPNVTLTVKNGTVVSNSMVGLIPSAMGGTIKYDNAGLVFEDVTMTANGHSGIETNGNNTNDAVTLKDSTLNVPDGFGIYFPSSGTLTIDNSTITAKTMGVQVCAGSLNITGEKTAIDVTGGPVDKTENDGAIQDGAAISIVNRTGYKGLGDVTVTGGKFTAKAGNDAIKAYDWANKTASKFTAAEQVAVSGGTFSSAVPEGLCATGFIPTTNGDGTYGVKAGAYVAQIGDVKYETLKDAINAATAGQTVTLLTNIDSSVSATYTAQDLTIDLNGYTIKGGTLSTAALKLSVKAVSDANYAVTITSSKDGGAIIGQLPLQLGGSYLANEIKIAIDDSVKLTVLEGGTNAVNQTGSRVYLVGTDTTKAYYKNGGFMVTVNGEDRIYETLGNARSADPNVTLLNDYTTTGALKIWGDWGAFTLDLNGHTYMSTTSQPSMIELQTNAKATFKNGTLKADKAQTVIGSPYDNTTLTLENVTVEAGGDYGIATNGSNTGINITLNDSSIKAPNGVGVYFPSTGSLTINGGSILANTGVQVSAGSLTITGGSITATGTSTEDVSSGSILDGAAVSIIARDGYGALGTLSISGGTFISASGVAAVQAYSIVGGVKDNNWTDTGFITGGSFNNIPEDMAKLCAEGYTYTMPTDDDPMYYVVKADEEQIDVKRSLTLGNTLIMNYKVLLPEGYTNPHIVFESYDAKAGAFYSVPVADYTLQTKGEETRYVFAFTETNPQRMTDTLKATVYATKGETEKAFPIDDYSVANYCNALLASDANKNGAYDELVGNLVAYGTAAQLYQNYHTDKLVKDVVNGGTAVTYPISEAVEVNNLNKVTGGVVIETKSLVLNNAFAIRVKFTLEDNTTIDQVKFTVAVDGKTTTIGSESFHEGTLSNGNSCYYFDFADLNSRQLGSTVTFTAVVNGTNNDVLEFSANTYLKLMAEREGVSTELMNLLTTLYNYGCTCGKFK